MANNILIQSGLNPLKFITKGAAIDARYRTKRMEDYIFRDSLHKWQTQVKWWQPWTQEDTITIQFWSNYAPFSIRMIDCITGAQVGAAVSMDYVVSSIEDTGLKVYQKSIALSAIDKGIYYFEIDCGSPVLRVLQSEIIRIDEFPESLLIEYYNEEENDFDLLWEKGLTMSYRIPGGLREWTPGVESVIHIDQNQGAIQLSSSTFYTERLIVGTAEGVPDWVAQRVNDIFQCSNVKLDGKQYIRSENATLEATREEDYPIAGWSLEVRPSDPSATQRTSDEPSDNPSSIVYNIDNRGFGPITTTGTITPIKAIE